MTIDNLLAVEVVTADGQLLRADANDHPDLFWALRGGGGNFGVATRFQFRLHPLGQVVGGMLLLPASADVLAEFIALAEAAPEELSTIANVMPAPPLPFIPAQQHGQLIILGLMVYAGDVEDGQRAVAPFRSLATPLADLVKPMAYPEIYPPEDPNYHPAAVAHTMFLDHIDHNAAETILEQLQASDASLRVAQLRVLGGAMARMPVEATAFAHRRSAIMANVASFYDGPADKPRTPGLGRPVRGGPAPKRRRRLCRIPHRRGLGTGPQRLPGVDVGPAGPGQGPLRPQQPVPPQPQHPDRDQRAAPQLICLRNMRSDKVSGAAATLAMTRIRCPGVGGVTSRWRDLRTEGDRRLCRVKRSWETKQRPLRPGRSCLLTARGSAIGV